MNKSKQKIFLFGVVGLSIFLLLFVVSCVWIGRNVKSQCRQAEKEYGGDCVEALITLLNDESKDFRSRNSAIWALGQLGGKRALLVLQTYYTSSIPEREPFDKAISQYELKKAIALTRGGFNITAIFWRHGIVAD